MTAGDLFLHSSGLWALVAVPAVVALLVWLGRRRTLAGERLLGVHVSALAAGRSLRRRAWKRGLFGLALLLGTAALCGPTWGNPRSSGGERGVDLVVCLDVSRSMLARDQTPTRLGAAQDAIQELAARAGGDRIALVLFAGEAQRTVPLTLDGDSLVRAADAAGPLSIPRGGTDLGAALDAALALLGGASGEHEAVFLLTDGDDAEARGRAAAGRAAARGIAVHCVGYGSRRGSKIAVDEGEGETFVRDRDGNEVVSVMDAPALERIAAASGGSFRAAVDETSPLVAAYDAEIVPMARKAFEDEEKKERENRYQWPLAAAFVLLLADLGLSERRMS